MNFIETLRRWLANQIAPSDEMVVQNITGEHTTQHVYQAQVSDTTTNVTYNAQVIHVVAGGSMVADGKLTLAQVKALDTLLDAIVLMNKVKGVNDYGRDYFASKLCEIAKVKDWQRMNEDMYERSVRYLMKCVNFKAVD